MIVLGELRDVINSFLEKERNRLRTVAIKAANTAIDAFYEESWKMFDSFIDQYYSYSTLSYIRHGESKPGTKRGINLYRANQIRKKNGDNPTINIQIDASDMEDGYQYDSPTFVLENVMHGYRGVPGKWLREWTGNYVGKYFSYSGTPANAFRIFESHFDEIAGNIYDEEFNKNI